MEHDNFRNLNRVIFTLRKYPESRVNAKANVGFLCSFTHEGGLVD